jgi:hypothetical protein
MTRISWERLAALAGLAFVVLFVVPFVWPAWRVGDRKALRARWRSSYITVGSSERARR